MCRLSEGHPLALSYLLKQLATAKDVSTVSEILESANPYQGHIDRIYDVYWQGIEKDEMLRDLLALMRSLHMESNWNRAAEEKMRKWQGDIGLKLTNNRLRPMVSLNAISYVVAELADSDMLDANQLMIAYIKLYLYEWRLAGKEPIKRSCLLNPPAQPDISGYRNDWVYNRDDAFDYFVDKLEDGFTLLGELSTFKEWDWGVPTEQRFTIVCHPAWVDASSSTGNAHDFFPYHQIWRAKEYPRLPFTNSIPAFVVYGLPRQAILGATEWLAFNPPIALHLGWHLSEEGIFRWLDKDGQIMVESRWWQDGPMHRQATAHT